MSCSCDPGALSLRTIDGSATLRMVLSTPMTTRHMHSVPRITHRRLWMSSSCEVIPRFCPAWGDSSLSEGFQLERGGLGGGVLVMRLALGIGRPGRGAGDDIGAGHEVGAE